jgi:signal transduction histidine kinase
MVGLLPVDVEGGGLRAAFERLAAETTAIYRVTCRFDCQDDIQVHDNFIATQLFLIASEATRNAAKHARAHEIVIRLADEDGLRITVTDNGTGLSPDAESSSGMGLRIMRHRASLIGAELRWESPADGGTRVSCHWPGGRGACQPEV